MSFIRRLLGRDVPATAEPPGPGDSFVSVLPAGPLYELPRGAHVAVHGESFRQPAIKALVRTCSPHPQDGRPTCDVVLVAEPENPYDVNAIAVHASTGHVGYLPREVAPDFGLVFAELARLGYVGGRCGAVITGGEPGKPSYGVVLLLDYSDVCLRGMRSSVR